MHAKQDPNGWNTNAGVCRLCSAMIRWPDQPLALARLPRAGEALSESRSAGSLLSRRCEAYWHGPVATLCMLAREHCHSRTRLTSDSRFMSSPVRVLSKKPVSCPISRLNNLHLRRHMTRSAAELNSLPGSMVPQRWSGRSQSRVLRTCVCPQACGCHAGLLHEMPQHAGWLLASQRAPRISYGWLCLGVTLKPQHSPCRRR